MSRCLSRVSMPLNRALLVVSLILANGSIAEEPALLPPMPPWVKIPPSGSQWTMEIRYPENGFNEANPEKQVRPVSLHMEVGGNGVQRGAILYSDESQSEFYATRGLLLSKARNTGRVIVRTNVSNSPYALETPVFPGVGWLNASHYVGQEEMDGVKYYRFSTTKPISNDQEFDSPVVAMVQVANRHPMQVELPGCVYIFSPVTRFAQDIRLPDDYIEALKNWSKRQLTKQAKN